MEEFRDIKEQMLENDKQAILIEEEQAKLRSLNVDRIKQIEEIDRESQSAATSRHSKSTCKRSQRPKSGTGVSKASRKPSDQ